MQIALAQVAVESIAQPVDDRRIGLQQHTLAQAIDKDCRHQRPICLAPGFLLDDGGHDQRLLRRPVGQALRPLRPLGIEFAPHGTMRSCEQVEIAGLLVEEVGIREKLALQRRAANSQAIEQLRFAQPGRVVA
ncbi:hypothetical protein SDC9_186734 [bioreactor metagenome]|uniref:Uncharacterized protein n=1 Tax=bioreactor metagenome TaxID=1076179 RepID=A0A645HKS2_9ZZZZ